MSQWGRSILAVFVCLALTSPWLSAKKKAKESSAPAGNEPTQAMPAATSVDLPAPAEHVAVGGGGQYLALN